MDPSPIIAIVGVVFLAVLAAYIHSVSSDTPPPRPKTPEELDQEAAWYRAEKRRVEAMTEYEMKLAELQDTRNFLQTRNQKS